MAMQSIEPFKASCSIRGTRRTTEQDATRPATSAASHGMAHLLAAIRMESRETDVVALALRLAVPHGARVTFLCVLPPTESNSHHWLDAIDAMYRKLAGAPRDAAAAIRKVRAELVAFLEREVPREARETIDLRVECRVGDFVEEVARAADEKSVDLVVLGGDPLPWRPSFWPRASHRALRRVSRPIVFAASRTGSPGANSAR